MLSVPVSANAAFPGRNGRLAVGAFDPTPPFNYNIWTLQPDGSDMRQVTTDPNWEYEPAWSPNGRWIAFTRLGSVCCVSNGGGDIWISRPDGTDQRRITDDSTDDTSPAWSPDGSKIVFAATSDKAPFAIDPNYDLYVVNADGSGRRLLVSEERRSEFDPAWSPDGTRIAFASDLYNPDGLSHPEVHPGLRTVRADGSDEQLVVPRSELAYAPDWSPDGKSIAYTNGLDIFKVSPNGGDSTQFPRRTYTGDRIDPTWSPDGQRIAFSGFLFGHMALDGTNNTFLLSGVGGSSWQPLGPRREDFRNRPAFCRAEREFLGEAEFALTYRNFGGCVSVKG